jgi:peptide/nickel transport system substrate-binding protein
LRLSRPSAPLLSALTDRPGFMISPTAARGAGPDYASKPVGTGPFKFSEYVPDSHASFTRNEAYWEKDLPGVDSVRYEIRTDESVRMADIRSGNLDVVDVVPPKDVASLKTSNDLQLISGQGLVKNAMIFQCSNPPFNNQALREAVRLAIDLDAVNKAAFFGTAAVSRQTSLVPGSFWHDESRTLTKRDVAAAKQKLAEGGQPGGFSFVAKIINVGTDLQSYQIYKQQLAEAGITMEIQPLETGAYVDAFLKGNFQATRVGGYGRPDPDEYIRYFLYSTGRYGPGVAWNNKDFDQLLDQGASTYDRDARKKAYNAAEAIVDREVPIIYTIHEGVNIGASKKVRDVVPYPDGLLRLKRAHIG